MSYLEDTAFMPDEFRAGNPILDGIDFVLRLLGLVEHHNPDTLYHDLKQDRQIHRWNQQQATSPMVPRIQDNMPEWYHDDVFKPIPVQTQHMPAYHATLVEAAGRRYSADPIETNFETLIHAKNYMSQERALLTKKREAQAKKRKR